MKFLFQTEDRSMRLRASQNHGLHGSPRIPWAWQDQEGGKRVGQDKNHCSSNLKWLSVYSVFSMFISKSFCKFQPVLLQIWDRPGVHCAFPIPSNVWSKYSDLCCSHSGSLKIGIPISRDGFSILVKRINVLATFPALAASNEQWKKGP